jgi:hypothetical protein
MPAFYYSPDEDGVIKKVDLVRSLSELRDMPRRVRVAPVNGRGQPVRFDFGSQDRVLIEAERMSTEATMLRLRSMETALRRGQSVTFANTPAKLWVGFIPAMSGGLTAGDTVLETGGNVFGYETAAIAQGDVIVIESGAPESLSERLTVSSVSGNDITVTTPVLYSRTAELGVTVRHHTCYPALFLPDDQQDAEILSTERGRLFDVAMELQVNGRFFTAGLGPYTMIDGLNL